MATVLCLIRHGEAEGDEKRRYKGALDLPLSPRGEEQMKRTAQFLNRMLDGNGKRLSAVYCSDLIRARRSAEILSSIAGPAPTVVPGLRERGFGAWEGMTFEEIEARWPDAFRAWAKDPLDHSPMDGETTLEVSERANMALDAVLERHRGEAVAVVAHGGVNRVLLCRFLGLPLENLFRIEQDHAAVSIVEFYEGLPVVRLLNCRGY